MTPPRSVIIGASAGVGRALAERLASQGHDLFLVAGSGPDLAPLARDLEIRFGIRAFWMDADITRLAPEALREKATVELGGVDNLLLIAGQSMISRDNGPLPAEDLERLVSVNMTAPIRIINAFMADLDRPGTNLVGAGSVAGVRGRRNNIVYAAAKRGVECYFQSMRHRFAATGGARVQFYRLGFIRTAMTFGQTSPLPFAEPDAIARRIAGNLDRDLGSVYLPGWWRVVMALIRLLPWPLFRRLNF